MLEMFKMLDASGFETEPFDRGALITYARQGIVQPTTPILEITTGSWKPASELIRLWSDSHAPQTSRPQLGASSGLSGRTLALTIIGGVALVIIGGFVALKFRARPAPQQTPKNQPQIVTTADGRYAVNVSPEWIQRKSKRPGTVEYTSRHRHSGFGMLQVSPAVITSSELAAFMDNSIRVSSSAAGMNPVGVAQPITIHGFSGLQQDVRKGGLAQNSQIRTTLLQTPDGIYSIIVFVDNDSNFSLKDLDMVSQSFHPVAVGRAAPRPQ